MRGRYVTSGSREEQKVAYGDQQVAAVAARTRLARPHTAIQATARGVDNLSKISRPLSQQEVLMQPITPPAGSLCVFNSRRTAGGSPQQYFQLRLNGTISCFLLLGLLARECHESISAIPWFSTQDRFKQCCHPDVLNITRTKATMHKAYSCHYLITPRFK